MPPAVPDRHDFVAPRSVLLVGGGRWGRVHAGNLRKLLPAGARLLWVSTHNFSTLTAQAAAQPSEGPTISLFSNLDQAIAQKPDAAIIVTAAHTHATLARATLTKRIPTFVEKPLTLDEDEATELVALAERERVVFGVGLHMFFASYLHYFHSLWPARTVESCHLTWIDVETEIRYGETKKADIWTNMVHDVFPHLWSIMRVLFPSANPVVRDASIGARGTITLTLGVGAVAIKAEIGRHGSERSRKIELRFLDGGSALLDYTQEPGVIELDGHRTAPDPAWKNGPRPLATEIAGFFRAYTDADEAARWPCRASAALGSVTRAVAAADRAATAAALIVARDFGPNTVLNGSAELNRLLVDNIAPEICGMRSELAGRDAESLIAIAAIAALHTRRAGVTGSPEVPPDLSAVVRASQFFRRVLTAESSVA